MKLIQYTMGVLLCQEDHGETGRVAQVLEEVLDFGEYEESDTGQDEDVS